MTTQNEQEPVAQAPETPAEPDQNTGAAEDVRDKDALIRSLMEARDRTAPKLEEYKRLKEAEEQRRHSELEAKGEYEKLISHHKGEVTSWKSRYESLLKVNAANEALSGAGFTDPDIAAMARTHLLSSVEATVDVDSGSVIADYEKKAKKLAKKLLTPPAPQAAPPVIGIQPAARTNPSQNEHWTDTLKRNLKKGLA